jgi:hypothetical protein
MARSSRKKLLNHGFAERERGFVLRCTNFGFLLPGAGCACRPSPEGKVRKMLNEISFIFQ